MEVLGVGPLEVLLIVLLAIVLFGPKDIARTARTAGRTLNRLYHSEGWRTLLRTSADSADAPESTGARGRARRARRPTPDDSRDGTIRRRGRARRQCRPAGLDSGGPPGIQGSPAPDASPFSAFERRGLRLTDAPFLPSPRAYSRGAVPAGRPPLPGGAPLPHVRTGGFACRRRPGPDPGESVQPAGAHRSLPRPPAAGPGRPGRDERRQLCLRPAHPGPADGTHWRDRQPAGH